MNNAVISKLIAGERLTEQESYAVFDEIMEGKLSPVQTGVFLTLLKVKKEQPSEILGAARLLRDKAVRVTVKKDRLADTCGTGGDLCRTFNISTAAGLLAPACGLPVAKHGNRAVSSRCGSADVMEALGYPIEVDPEKNRAALEKFDFAFFFAPVYHRAMKNVAAVRKELGFRTIFNIIGPLCNPAGANVQIMGVSDYQLLKTVPYVLQKLGIRGYVFCGDDGTDEISLTGKTFLVEVRSRRITEMEIHPQHFGFRTCRRRDLAGGDAGENADMIKNILRGELKGPRRDVVVCNTGVLLKAAGVVNTFQDGIAAAEAMLNSGKAWERLQSVLEFLNR